VALEPDLAAELRAGWGRILTSGWRRALVKAASRMDLRSESVLRRVDAYIRAHRGDPIYVTDLCKAAGVPERTLQHVFRRRFALRPMEYVTSIRLDQARRAIFEAASGAVSTVTRIAASVGFDHMGRFAALYRRMFGETPRDTVVMLRRRNATARRALSRAASRG
jgi:transcriptional regulator GlxA family with amidase domain